MKSTVVVEISDADREWLSRYYATPKSKLDRAWLRRWVQGMVQREIAEAKGDACGS